MAATPNNRSTLKEFLASIATIKGDLSSITAPPFLLSTQSTVVLPQYWVEKPSVFIAPALEPEPQKRALLVLRWFLASLKRQQYAGRTETEGVKKPLNAFLGELFLGQWNDEMGDTRLISEQVSHHPPITACSLWNDTHGIRAEGYACQRITFNGSVNIKQIGHAIIHIDKYNEDHLIPLPDIKVTGLLSGTPYPEIVGSYQIISSSGFVAEIDFSGKRLLGLGGKKNQIHAALYSLGDEKRKSPIYEVNGGWNDTFTIHDVVNNRDIETYDTEAQQPTALSLAPLEQQDPWESRRAWAGVIDALDHGDMHATSVAKSKVEDAQRQLRKKEEAEGTIWEPMFFTKTGRDELFSKLSAAAGDQHSEDHVPGFWKFNVERARAAQKPYHGGLRPDQAA